MIPKSLITLSLIVLFGNLLSAQTYYSDTMQSSIITDQNNSMDPLRFKSVVFLGEFPDTASFNGPINFYD